MINDKDLYTTIFDYYRPRHTHCWNMLLLSWKDIDRMNDYEQFGFETEYYWESFIIRLWLYRTAVKTLEKLPPVKNEATRVVRNFDATFETNGQNGLKIIRDMIEHFDDYAAGQGRGPGIRESDLDPWRTIAPNRYSRGRFSLDRTKSYEATMQLKLDADRVSESFIQNINLKE